MKGSDKVAKKVNVQSEPVKKLSPMLTKEARENRMISLAMDLVEQRLQDGTATSQETTHFLKLASEKSQIEVEKLRLENELIKAKTKAVNSSESAEKLYSDAIKAFQRYSGTVGEDVD